VHGYKNDIKGFNCAVSNCSLGSCKNLTHKASSQNLQTSGGLTGQVGSALAELSEGIALPSRKSPNRFVSLARELTSVIWLLLRISILRFVSSARGLTSIRVSLVKFVSPDKGLRSLIPV
jgi:hypothetical protein